jgi:hypothetical protein
MSKADYASWCTGIIHKRTADALSVLADLIRAGLARGYCTANDVRDRSYDEPNIISACFKVLPNVGFKQTSQRIKPDARRKHGRLLYIWNLVEPAKARQFLRQCEGRLWELEPETAPALPGF